MRRFGSVLSYKRVRRGTTCGDWGGRACVHGWVCGCMGWWVRGRVDVVGRDRSVRRRVDGARKAGKKERAKQMKSERKGGRGGERERARDKEREGVRARDGVTERERAIEREREKGGRERARQRQRQGKE
eukprot:2475888-Pleurochrysis_carterae.AAC.3